MRPDVDADRRYLFLCHCVTVSAKTRHKFDRERHRQAALRRSRDRLDSNLVRIDEKAARDAGPFAVWGHCEAGVSIVGSVELQRRYPLFALAVSMAWWHR